MESRYRQDLHAMWSTWARPHGLRDVMSSAISNGLKVWEMVDVARFSWVAIQASGFERARETAVDVAA